MNALANMSAGDVLLYGLVCIALGAFVTGIAIIIVLKMYAAHERPEEGTNHEDIKR